MAHLKPCLTRVTDQCCWLLCLVFWEIHNFDEKSMISRRSCKVSLFLTTQAFDLGISKIERPTSFQGVSFVEGDDSVDAILWWLADGTQGFCALLCILWCSWLRLWIQLRIRIRSRIRIRILCNNCRRVFVLCWPTTKLSKVGPKVAFCYMCCSDASNVVGRASLSLVFVLCWPRSRSCFCISKCEEVFPKQVCQGCLVLHV